MLLVAMKWTNEKEGDSKGSDFWVAVETEGARGAMEFSESTLCLFDFAFIWLAPLGDDIWNKDDDMRKRFFATFVD